MENDELIQVAYKRAEEIRELLSKGNAYYLEAGFKLRDARDNRDWKALGYMSFEEYMVSHLGFKSSTGYNYLGTAETFGKTLSAEPKYLEISPTRLYSLKPTIKEGEDLEEPLNHALHDTPEGFKNYVRERKGLKATDVCTHPVPITVCKQCGKRLN